MNDKELVLSLQNVSVEEATPQALPTIVTIITTVTSFWSTVSNNC